MASSPTVPPRDRGIDAVRGVAVLSMFVAHFAPGPADVVQLSDHLTAPLFGFLVAWGAFLGRDRPGVLVSTLVRAAALVGIGLALEQVGAPIIIVLVWLGALTLLAAVLVRLPSWAVAAVGLTCLALVPSAARWGDARITSWRTAEVLAGRDAQGLVPRLYELTVSGQAYRLTTLLVMAAAAVLLARHDGPWTRLVSLGTALVAATTLQLADLTGRVEVVPYATTHQTQVFALALVVTVVQAVRAVADAVTPFAGLLAPLGAMTLSVYVVQILASAWWVRDGWHVRDESWPLLAALGAVSFALALTWPRVVRPDPWRRGPIEGVERATVDLLRR
ncbi:hypothetical protein GCM10022215_40310 [Nocardioides fonticola]|uniref:DUF418 domain-containing protein n=1 Tax=Nocardioides fonticola TaxID=450363 RepID=A0ABP7Y0P7_9ACTN